MLTSSICSSLACLIRQIYCIFLFTNAACLFGSLISQLNDILQVGENEEGVAEREQREEREEIKEGGAGRERDQGRRDGGGRIKTIFYVNGCRFNEWLLHWQSKLPNVGTR
jgi:hypothetical protein